MLPQIYGVLKNDNFQVELRHSKRIYRFMSRMNGVLFCFNPHQKIYYFEEGEKGESERETLM